MTGREYAGSQGGRRAVLGALKTFELDAPTADLPHAIDGLLSIDHVAVPVGVHTSASRVTPSATAGGCPITTRTWSKSTPEVPTAYGLHA